MVQLSHPYMTTGKTIALNIQTFVSKVMPPLLIRYVCFDCVDHNKLWKVLKRWQYQTILPAS